jgi:hypothetical protein
MKGMRFQALYQNGMINWVLTNGFFNRHTTPVCALPYPQPWWIQHFICQKIPVKKLRVDSLAGLSMLDRFDSIHNVFAFVQSQYPVSIIKGICICTRMGKTIGVEKACIQPINLLTSSILLHGRYNNPADGPCIVFVHSIADGNLISFKPYHPMFFYPTNDTSKYFATRNKTGQVVLDSGETVILEYHVWNDMYLGANKTVITSTKPHIAQ